MLLCHACAAVTFAASCCGGGGGFGAGAAVSAAAGGHHGNRGGCCGRAGAVAAQPQAALRKNSAGLACGAGAGDGIGCCNEIWIPRWETAEYNANYGLGAINASTAYARGFTGDGVPVSLLDLPFDTNHADLQANLTTAYDIALDGDSMYPVLQMAVFSSHGYTWQGPSVR